MCVCVWIVQFDKRQYETQYSHTSYIRTIERNKESEWVNGKDWRKKTIEMSMNHEHEKPVAKWQMRVQTVTVSCTHRQRQREKGGKKIVLLILTTFNSINRNFSQQNYNATHFNGESVKVLQRLKSLALYYHAERMHEGQIEWRVRKRWVEKVDRTERREDWGMRMVSKAKMGAINYIENSWNFAPFASPVTIQQAS